LFKTDGEEISNLYRGPSIDASYQVSIHLAVVSEEKVLEIDQSEKIIACGGHVC
jgi:DnaJ-class molecular chaperone